MCVCVCVCARACTCTRAWVGVCVQGKGGNIHNLFYVREIEPLLFLLSSLFLLPPLLSPSPPSRLSELGGQCLHRRVDIDQEDWPKISSWMEGVVGEVTKLDLKTDTDYLDLSAVEETGHSRTRPFLAEMTVSLPTMIRYCVSIGELCWHNFEHNRNLLA